jgi:hypothetical protein
LHESMIFIKSIARSKNSPSRGDITEKSFIS